MACLAKLLAVTVVVASCVFDAGGARAQPASSASSPSPSVTGVGAARCEQVTEDGSEPGGGRIRPVYQSWAQGFLTALNFEQARLQSPVTNQAAIKADAQWLLLSDYCLLHPDDLFVHAVASLAGALNKALADSSGR